MTATLPSGPVRPPRGSMPKFYREVVNILIDQGWQYIPSDRGRKHKLIPPDPDKSICLVPSTPQWRQANAPWISQLRRSGAILDDETLERLTKRDSRQRLRRALRDHAGVKEVQVDPTVVPISTVGQFWRPPVPEAPPLSKPRVTPPPSKDDACGAIYTLSQARDMLRQGYHILKVVQRTGWGANHLKDLVDNTGYYNFQD